MVILIVEDDEKTAKMIKNALNSADYTVEVASDGEKAIEMIEVNDYDLVLLDLMLPKKDGMAVCKAVRELKINTPILMVTARETIKDRVSGLDYGADDYLVKPFSIDELLARVRALLRREKIVQAPILKVGELLLNPSKHEVLLEGKAINLTSKEYRILDYMMRRPGLLCSRTMLGEHIWGYSFQHDKKSHNLINVNIANLRKKIARISKHQYIVTIGDFGYKLTEPDSNSKAMNSEQNSNT